MEPRASPGTPDLRLALGTGPDSFWMRVRGATIIPWAVHMTFLTGELGILDRIRTALPVKRGVVTRGLLLGIGDDAALVRSPRGRLWVLSADAFFENVHFLGNVHSAESVGYKSLARAISDLAAMGAVPRFFLMTLGIPAHRSENWLDHFLKGMREVARECSVALIGGDTLQHSSVAISITVLGEAGSGGVVTRAGARPGDQVFISGKLGASQLGLELVLRGLHRDRRWSNLLRTHLRPPLRLKLGQWLARRRLASAMIDTSDGLSTDLAHLCRASQSGARIERRLLPGVRIPSSLSSHGFDALELALHGGEDYELLFTVPRRFSKRLPKSFLGVPLTRIGEVTRGKRMELIFEDGRSEALTPRGWDHFRSK